MLLHCNNCVSERRKVTK